MICKITPWLFCIKQNKFWFSVNIVKQSVEEFVVDFINMKHEYNMKMNKIPVYWITSLSLIIGRHVTPIKYFCAQI